MARGQEEGDFVDLVFCVFFVGWEADLTVGGDVEGDVEGVWWFRQYFVCAFEGDGRGLEGREKTYHRPRASTVEAN